MAYHDLIGIAAALVGVVALVPYVRSVLQSDTEPSPVTWLLWTVSGSILAGSYYAIGATTTLWLSMAYVLNTFIIFLLSLRYGRMRMDVLDQVCLAGMVVSLLLWFGLNSPGGAMTVCMLIDALGAAPTLKKIFREPNKENKTGWILITTASAINLVAIDELSPAIVVYPAYAFIVTLTITLLLFSQPQRPIP